MGREHSAADLRETIQQIKARAPTVRLDTQIIVGFPTETEADLQETLDFVRDVGFDSVVVFPFDDKEGTLASQLEGKVSEAEIERRVQSAFRYFRHVRIRAYYSGV